MLWIVALLLGVLGSKQEAEDAAQEAFARALARWPKVSSYDLPEAWVRRVALRLAVDSGRWLRRGIRLSARLKDARQPPAAEPGDRVAFGDLGCALMRTACTLEGWPKLSISSPRALRTASISYATVLPQTATTAEASRSRIIKPTPVALPPQAQAAAAITVATAVLTGACGHAVWSVTPPHDRRPTLISRSVASDAQHQDRLPLCPHSGIIVSPVYPASVPVTQNYPPTAPGSATARGAP